MNIIKAVVAAAFAACAVAAPPAEAGPRVLGKKMSKDVICPAADTSKCVMSTGNTIPVYINLPQRFLPLDANGNPDYWRYLGRELTGDASQTVNFCGNVAFSNPLQKFAANHPDQLVIDPAYVGSYFTFDRKIEAMSSAGFDLDVDAALNAASIPTTTGRAKAEAALRAAVKKVKKTKLTMRGQFVFMTISPAVIGSMRAVDVPDELKGCAEFLKTNQSSLITALTGVKIDTMTTAGTIASNASAGFDAKLDDVLTWSQIAALKAEFTKRVESAWTVEFKPTFQVLSISGYRQLP